MPEAALKLRRATVIELRGTEASEQSVLARLDDGSARPAVVDVALLGPCEVGDELIVNVQARDLGLGSGGFDIVHVNLTKGLAGEGAPGAHVMKLNYTSLQHAVRPVEEERGERQGALRVEAPVGVLALHGQLAPLARAFSQAVPQARLGFVQTPGGALCGGHSRVVRGLLDDGLLAGHISAGAAFGGQWEAITTAGALHHGARELGWDAIVCGPGPGIVGSGSVLGHGGLHALDSAHTALALGAETLLVARMSSADPRERHRGVSHHTLTVLELLLRPVTVALPAGMFSLAGLDLRDVESTPSEDESVRRASPIADGLRRHDWRMVEVDTAGFQASGLPARTMGRTVDEDPLFFASPLAAGAVLADMCRRRAKREDRARLTT